ncbi:CinA family protein [Nocardiopsis coralliicola]
MPEARSGAPAPAASGADGPAGERAAAAVAALAASGATLATAESLTGGLIGALVTSVPGASAVYRGGVVSYATGVKAGLLGVDPQLLHRAGAVHPDVAVQMALGARRSLTAGFGLAVTGVAGPQPQDRQPVGRVYAAAAVPGGAVRAVRFDLPGGRPAIRAATAERALALLTACIGPFPGGPSAPAEVGARCAASGGTVVRITRG